MVAGRIVRGTSLKGNLTTGQPTGSNVLDRVANAAQNAQDRITASVIVTGRLVEGVEFTSTTTGKAVAHGLGRTAVGVIPCKASAQATFTWTADVDAKNTVIVTPSAACTASFWVF